jgi:hypothetical protein
MTSQETKQKWVEWLSVYRPLGLLVVFKEGEVLLKTHGQHASIGIYGNVTYTLYRPQFKGVWSQAIGREAFVTITWSEDEQSPDRNIDRVEVVVFPTKSKPEVEDGTVIIELYRRNDTPSFRLKWTDFTDIFVFATNAVAWIYPRNRKPEFAIDVYDEKILSLPNDIINKIMSEPYDYLSPKLEQQRIIKMSYH